MCCDLLQATVALISLHRADEVLDTAGYQCAATAIRQVPCLLGFWLLAHASSRFASIYPYPSLLASFNAHAGPETHSVRAGSGMAPHCCWCVFLQRIVAGDGLDGRYLCAVRSLLCCGWEPPAKFAR